MFGKDGQKRLLAGKHVHCDFIGHDEEVLIEFLPNEGSSAVLDQFHGVKVDHPELLRCYDGDQLGEVGIWQQLPLLAICSLSIQHELEGD